MKGGFRFKEEIPRRELTQIWKKTYPRKQFPKVKAFVLSDREFCKVGSHLERHQIDTSEKEYGRKLPIKDTFAITFYDEKQGTYVIVMRDRYSRQESLKHEFNHICKGEV